MPLSEEIEELAERVAAELVRVGPLPLVLVDRPAHRVYCPRCRALGPLDRFNASVGACRACR